METHEPMKSDADLPSLAATSVSRRRFLSGGAAAGMAVVAVACSKSKTTTASGASTTQATTATTAAGANADLDVAAAAAGLEKLAVDTYTAAGMLASTGKLGASVPLAVANFVSTATKQHQVALDSWNKVLTSGGRQAVSTPTSALAPIVNAAAAKLTDVPGTATLALRLEDYASQTYQQVIPTLKSADAIKLAAQIAVVEAQHQAILRYVIGLYPVGSGPIKNTNGLANVDFAPANPQVSLITG